jgi:hypothetical protein
MYQIYGKLEGKEWELIDTTETKNDLDYMLEEYKIAFGKSWEWKIQEIDEEEEAEE